MLFQASTWFTEYISVGKYPKYKLYQKHVGMFIPNPLKIAQGSAWKTSDNTQDFARGVKEQAKK
jgi:hypothetical protein